LPNEVIEVSISPLNQFYIPIRTYHSSETDQEIAYFPDGNSKYAIYTIDTTNPEQPTLEVQLKIQGGTVWKHVFHGKKVERNTLSIERGRTLFENWLEWIEKMTRRLQHNKRGIL
jgi:alkaline phosphatase D